MRTFGKKAAAVLSLVLLAAMLLSFAACEKVPPIGSTLEGEEIDKTKTQLNVFVYSGGYGTKWLELAAERFEELYKDVSFEEGKKGVQVYLDPQKTTFTTLQTSIKDGQNDVFFGEWGMYYTLKNAGLLLDITEAVTTPLTQYGEDRSIVDKLDAQQKAYYGFEEADGTHYYALPHTQSRFGIVYNIELFDEMGYYFAKKPTGSALEDQFISKTNPTKSAGPDGLYNTSDDGLPATYEEFYQLCDYIKQQSQTPIVFSTGATYMNWLWTHLWTDYEGADAASNFTFTGTADDLITIDVEKNKILKDAGVTEITTENAYELGRSAGKYYALEFMEKILTSNWLHSGSTSGTTSYRDCQRTFINAGYDDGKTTEIAMMFEGPWWEEEASSDFTKMEQAGKPGRSERRFGYMPLPKANKEKVAEAAAAENPYTEYEILYPLRFIKSNVPEYKKQLAIDFLVFMCTDETLCEGTVATNSFFSYDYTLSDEQLASMSSWGRSFYEAQSRSTVVYPYSNEALFLNNQTFFSTENYCVKSYWGGKTYEGFFQNFVDGKISAAEFFSGVYEYEKRNWPQQ